MKLICYLFLFLLISSQTHADIFVKVPLASQVALASAARTTDTSVVITTVNPQKCGQFVVNITAYTAGSLTAHIQNYSPVTDTYYDVLVSTALAATGTTILKVCPGITAAANLSVADFLSPRFKIYLHPSTSDAITYSVGMNLVP